MDHEKMATITFGPPDVSALEDAAFTRIMKPTHGAQVGVIAGTKVHIGAVGVVVGMTKDKARVFFENTETGKRDWLEISHVARIDRDDPPAGTTWVKYEAIVAASDAAKQKALPIQKGDHITLASGEEARVFWVQNTRIGYTVSGRMNLVTKKYEDATFADMAEVVRLNTKPNDLSVEMF